MMMANWQWILFWILIAAPFALNILRVIRTQRRDRTDKGLDCGMGAGRLSGAGRVPGHSGGDDRG
jgi:hypothetical protein